MRWCPVRGFFSAAQVALRAPCEANVATAPVGASPGVDKHGSGMAGRRWGYGNVGYRI